jgi:hypothetical protein
VTIIAKNTVEIVEGVTILNIEKGNDFCICVVIGCREGQEIMGNFH